MSYKFTKEDFEDVLKTLPPAKEKEEPQEGGYKMTLADLNEFERQNRPGMLSSIGSALKNIGAGALQGTYDTAKALSELAIKGFVPTSPSDEISRLIQEKTGKTITQAPPLLKEYKVPFGERESLAYKGGELIPEIAQFVIPGYKVGSFISRKGPGLINKLDTMLTKKGYTPEYLNRLRGKTLEPLQEQYQGHTSKMLSDYYGKDFKNQIGNEEQISAKAIHDAYNEPNEISNNLYNSMKKKESWNKNIEKPEIFNNVKEIYKIGEGRLGRNLTEKLNTFNEAPTAGNAHEVQSAIGAQLRDYHELEPHYRPPRSVIEDLQKTRESLRENIGNVLGNEYKKASDFYKENVAPFHNDPTISNILKGKIPSAESMARRIGKGTALPGEDQIAPEALISISKKMRPQDREKFLLSFIKGSPGNPVVDVFGELNPDALLSKVKGLKTLGLGKFISEPMMNDFNKLNELNKAIAKEKLMIEKSRKRASSLAKYGAHGLTGIGMGGTMHYLSTPRE